MSGKVHNPPSIPKPSGYNHGFEMPGSRILFVAGQSGETTTGTVPEAFVEQFDVALGRVMAVVKAAGGRADNIGRLTIYVTDMDEYLATRPALNAVYRKHLGRHYPAMSALGVASFIQPEMKVELEATAVLE
ncbi:MAG: RidA family protein [Candidatus Lernaella stagnicola]|nr:RidA family protein [Candidatus Lernaella stagnicola]